MNTAAPTCLRPAQHIVCKTAGCGHVLARIGESGGVYPVVPNYYERGSVVLTCPLCREKRKIQLRDRAA